MPDVVTINSSDALTYQRWEWRVERVWWAVLGALLLAAVAGAFGSGPVSTTTVGGVDAGGEITYERLAHFTGPTTWTIRVHTVSDGRARVHIDESLIERMTIQNITPAPVAQTGTREGVRYTFRADPASPPLIRLSVLPESVGMLEGAVRVGDGGKLDVSVFAYP